MRFFCFFFFFFFNDTATTEIYTLSLHDALPIWSGRRSRRRSGKPTATAGAPPSGWGSASGRFTARSRSTGSAEQGDSGEPPHRFLFLPGIEPEHPAPEPRHGEAAIQPDGLVEHRAVFGLLPAVGLEEPRALGRGKAHGCVSRAQGVAPGLLQHLQQLRAPEVHQPPLERRLRVEVLGQARHLLRREIDQQPFGDHQDPSRRGAQLLEHRAAGGQVGEIQALPLDGAARLLAVEVLFLVVQHVREIRLHPAQRAGQREPVGPGIQAGGEVEHRVGAFPEAHGETPGQQRRLIPAVLHPSACYACHGLETLPAADTTIVVEGIKLINEYKCLRCHQLDGSGGSIGPDLSGIASQRNWVELYAHLLKPAALTPGSTMPDFGLRRREATAITAFLLTRLSARDRVMDVTYLTSVSAPAGTPATTTVIPSTQSLPAPNYDGRELFAGLECSVCHRVGLAGGEVGPALTHIGRARDAAWLRDLLADPARVFPDGQMPAYSLSEAQVMALVDYLMTLK